MRLPGRGAQGAKDRKEPQGSHSYTLTETKKVTVILTNKTIITKAPQQAEPNRSTPTSPPTTPYHHRRTKARPIVQSTHTTKKKTFVFVSVAIEKHKNTITRKVRIALHFTFICHQLKNARTRTQKNTLKYIPVNDYLSAAALAMIIISIVIIIIPSRPGNLASSTTIIQPFF